MKSKYLLIAATLGVFLMIDTSLLAQSTGTSSERSSSRSSSRSTVVVPAAPAVPSLEDIEITEYGNSFVYTTTSSDKNSKLTLSKKYKDATTTKKGTFNVDEGVKKIRISISGKVTAGKINIELYLPDGKEVGKFLIDDTADVHWSHSINVEDDETKYFGEWTFNIKASYATGSYALTLSTY